MRVKNIIIEPPHCLLKYEGEGKAAELKEKQEGKETRQTIQTNNSC